MTKIKDLISIFRDGLLLILFILLIFFPTTLNDMLTKAGFTQGSVMGFTWEDKAMQSKEVADSSQLLAQAASTQLEEMQNRLDSISQKLASLPPSAANTPVVHAITESISSSKKKVSSYNTALKRNVVLQNAKLNTIFNGTPIDKTKTIKPE